jgi:hypothetical protein
VTDTHTHPHDHTHEHQHGAEHGHSHPPETPAGPSGAGTVILDIGPGVGAAIVRTPASMLDLEIEYRAAGDPWEEKHMAVRERLGGATVQYAAVYGPLPMGDYEFRVRGGGGGSPVAELTLTVPEASVVSGDWPEPSA